MNKQKLINKILFVILYFFIIRRKVRPFYIFSCSKMYIFFLANTLQNQRKNINQSVNKSKYIQKTFLTSNIYKKPCHYSRKKNVKKCSFAWKYDVKNILFLLKHELFFIKMVHKKCHPDSYILSMFTDKRLVLENM